MWFERTPTRLVNILCAVFSLIFCRSLSAVTIFIHSSHAATIQRKAIARDCNQYKCTTQKKKRSFTVSSPENGEKCKRKVIELSGELCEEFHYKFYDCNTSFSNGLETVSHICFCSVSKRQPETCR